MHTSVEILQICMDLQDSVQLSLQSPVKNLADLPRLAKIKILGVEKLEIECSNSTTTHVETA